MVPSAGIGGDTLEEYRSETANIARRSKVGIRRLRRLNGDAEVDVAEFEFVSENGDPGVSCL